MGGNECARVSVCNRSERQGVEMSGRDRMDAEGETAALQRKEEIA